MKAILHIGSEKTGTTTIQSFLVQNKKMFAGHGYLVPSSVGVGNNRGLVSCAMGVFTFDDYHHARGISSDEQRNLHDLQIITKFKDELAENKSCHTVIISSEHFQSRLTTIEQIHRLYSILNELFIEIMNL